MKLRIQDNSIRFRITIQELEQLQSLGRVEKTCRIPNGPQGEQSFQYALEYSRECRKSHVVLEEASLTLYLNRNDMENLSLASQEGIYIRREWKTNNNGVERFMAFVEKDRPSSACIKKEAWIYEGHRGGRDTLKAVPSETEA